MQTLSENLYVSGDFVRQITKQLPNQVIRVEESGFVREQPFTGKKRAFSAKKTSGKGRYLNTLFPKTAYRPTHVPG